MITRGKLLSLEKKFMKSAKQTFGGLVIRKITQDGRLLGNDNYLLTRAQLKQIEIEDMEAKERGCTIVNLVSYDVPKLKLGSSKIPYCHIAHTRAS